MHKTDRGSIGPDDCRRGQRSPFVMNATSNGWVSFDLTRSLELRSDVRLRLLVVDSAIVNVAAANEWDPTGPSSILSYAVSVIQRKHCRGESSRPFRLLPIVTSHNPIPSGCFDGLLQFRGLGELRVQFGDEARHLFLEGFAVVFDFFGADIAAGSEHIAVRRDLVGGC